MPKKVLLIGGTRFVGRHIVSCLLKSGYEVVLFNRGNQKGVFANVRQISGDRDRGFEPLKDEKFDVIIDTCCYFPKQMEIAMDYFSRACGQYVLISSISCYRDFAVNNLDESYSLARYENIEKVREITEITYGPLKVECENVLKYSHHNNLIVRPGYIVGPWDYTGRFTWWLVRAFEGGLIPVPGDKKDKIQFIDVRDLAKWLVLAIDKNLSGDFNLVGPRQSYTLTDLLGVCSKQFKTEMDIKYVCEDSLSKHNAQNAFPIWSSSVDQNNRYSGDVSNQKAWDNGLKLRDVNETVKDTMDWWFKEGDVYPLVGPDLHLEKMLLGKSSV